MRAGRGRVRGGQCWFVEAQSSARRSSHSETPSSLLRNDRGLPDDIRSNQTAGKTCPVLASKTTTHSEEEGETRISEEPGMRFDIITLCAAPSPGIEFTREFTRMILQRCRTAATQSSRDHRSARHRRAPWCLGRMLALVKSSCERLANSRVVYSSSGGLSSGCRERGLLAHFKVTPPERRGEVVTLHVTPEKHLWMDALSSGYRARSSPRDLGTPPNNASSLS